MEERSHRHILNLVTQMTITGLSANEIECALIPMMARNISSTMKPNTLTHDQTRYLKLILATHGRSIHWVKSRLFCSLELVSVIRAKADKKLGVPIPLTFRPFEIFSFSQMRIFWTNQHSSLLISRTRQKRGCLFQLVPELN